jgi:hypothetical protein
MLILLALCACLVVALWVDVERAPTGTLADTQGQSPASRRNPRLMRLRGMTWNSTAARRARSVTAQHRCSSTVERYG